MDKESVSKATTKAVPNCLLIVGEVFDFQERGAKNNANSKGDILYIATELEGTKETKTHAIFIYIVHVMPFERKARYVSSCGE